MAGLGMLGASRLSSIWAGRCAKGENDDTKSQISIRGSIQWRPLCHFLWKSKFHGVFSRGWEKTKKRFCFFSLICLMSLLLASLFFCFFFAAYWAIPLSLLSGSSRDPKCKCVQSPRMHAHTHAQPPCTWRRTNTYARSNLYLLSMVNAYV